MQLNGNLLFLLFIKINIELLSYVKKQFRWSKIFSIE